MSKIRYGYNDVMQAREHLKGLIDHDQPDAMYATITGVATSGMSRTMRLYLPCVRDERPSIEHVSHLVAKILNLPLTDKGVRVTGSGMDMVFHVVSSVSRALYGDDYKISYHQI